MDATDAWRIALQCMQNMDIIPPLDRRLVRPISIRQVYKVVTVLPNGSRCLCEVIDGKVVDVHVIEK